MDWTGRSDWLNREPEPCPVQLSVKMRKLKNRSTTGKIGQKTVNRLNRRLFRWSAVQQLPHAPLSKSSPYTVSMRSPASTILLHHPTRLKCENPHRRRNELRHFLRGMSQIEQDVTARGGFGVTRKQGMWWRNHRAREKNEEMKIQEMQNFYEVTAPPKEKKMKWRNRESEKHGLGDFGW